MDQKSAEAFTRLLQTTDGRLYFEELSYEFDKAMRALLYASSEDVYTAQGHARAIHEQLKKFTDAKKYIEGNTRGAS